MIYKRCVSSLGTGITPLENIYDLCFKAYSERQLAMSIENIFQEKGTCHILNILYVSQSPGMVSCSESLGKYWNQCM